MCYVAGFTTDALTMMRITLLVLFCCVVASPAQEAPRNKPDQRVALSPAEEHATFKLDPQFTIELVAAEPEVVDPVCFCFDARGDLYVVEMRGYPNGGRGEGKPNFPGRIKKLQDLDGDGRYESATIFAEGLRFPCGITPWRDGMLVGDAPDLLFINAKGEKRVLYTGFGNSNIQQMINGLQLHYDGWVYGCNGGNDSPVRSVEKPDAPVVQLRGMHFRFKPDVPGSLEPCSGGGQYGLAVTASGHWLTCTNSQHLRHIVLPHHYLKRQPDLTVPATTLDIPDHGAAARVFRLSPFEAWRLERTTRRAGSDDAKRFPSTELVPGGYITSACGLAVWDDGGLPAKYHGNVFVCDPANNLIHRDVLVPSGSTYVAQRHDKDCEFLASTDTWFRPVFLHTGPDGSLYVADFYREIIETPLSLPEDIKAKWNLNSRERGRIWRVKERGQSPSGKDPPIPANVGRGRLIAELNSTIRWQRNTAFRLLMEKSLTPELLQQVRSVAKSSSSNYLEAWWLLANHQLVTKHDLQDLLRLNNKAVHQLFALLQCEQLESVEDLFFDLEQLAWSPDTHVHYQLALCVGSMKLSPSGKRRLFSLLCNKPMDAWMEAALLSSTAGMELEMLKGLLERSNQSVFHNQSIPTTLMTRLAGIVRKRASVEALLKDEELSKTLADAWYSRHLSTLRGLGKDFCLALPSGHERVMRYLQDHKDQDDRDALVVLSYFPWNETKAVFTTHLAPTSPVELQQQVLQALKTYDDPAIAELLLNLWPQQTPAVRREVQEVLLGRPRYVEALLTRAEAGQLPWQQLDATRREQLLRSRNGSIQKRAKALQAKLSNTSRQQVIDRYQSSLSNTTSVEAGKQHFTKHCASCHVLEGKGHAVGPDLLGALGNKTRDALLIDILDPHREVDPRYLNYVIVTKAGRTLTGIIASENANSITLKRAEGVEEVVPRGDIDEMTSTGKSLMPDTLDEQLKPQDVADVIQYLLQLRKK